MDCSASNENNCYTFHDVDSTWNEARDACRDMGAHLVAMETTDEWNKVKGFLADKVTEPGSYTLIITLDSVEKVERGDGPRQDHLVSMWRQMTAAGSLASLLLIQGKFVAKSGIPVQGPKGTLIMSCAIDIYA